MNPNPLLIGQHNIVQRSRQVQDHLLCFDCEQLLSKNGESWFLANCLRKAGDFPLHTALFAASSITHQTVKVYHAANVPGVDISALMYFAASIFWRASVHKWRECKQINLGPYQEELRTYLLGQTLFPLQSTLVVSIPETLTEFTNLVMFPYGGRSDAYHTHKFLIRGIGYSLLTGKLIPQGTCLIDFVRGVGNPICMSDSLEIALMQDVQRKMRPSHSYWNGGLYRRSDSDRLRWPNARQATDSRVCLAFS